MSERTYRAPELEVVRFFTDDEVRTDVIRASDGSIWTDYYSIGEE